MFDPNITRAQLAALVESMTDVDFARFMYCQHIAATYLAVHRFEHMVISAMLMSDRVKVKQVLSADAKRWYKMMQKQAFLQDSTLGSLIKILERHQIAKADIDYLKWLKNKRDYFVHRLFHGDEWPGELDQDGCATMTRQLIAIQRWLSRGERRIWSIFERAGFVELDHLQDGGILAINADIVDRLSASKD